MPPCVGEVCPSHRRVELERCGRILHVRRVHQTSVSLSVKTDSSFVHPRLTTSRATTPHYARTTGTGRTPCALWPFHALHEGANPATSGHSKPGYASLSEPNRGKPSCLCKLVHKEVSAHGAVGFINPLFISEISLNLFQTSKIHIKFNPCPKFIKPLLLFF
jgi:hypothetical protein